MTYIHVVLFFVKLLSGLVLAGAALVCIWHGYNLLKLGREGKAQTFGMKFGPLDINATGSSVLLFVIAIPLLYFGTELLPDGETRTVESDKGIQKFASVSYTSSDSSTYMGSGSAGRGTYSSGDSLGGSSGFSTYTPREHFFVPQVDQGPKGDKELYVFLGSDLSSSALASTQTAVVYRDPGEKVSMPQLCFKTDESEPPKDCSSLDDIFFHSGLYLRDIRHNIDLCTDLNTAKDIPFCSAGWIKVDPKIGSK